MNKNLEESNSLNGLHYAIANLTECYQPVDNIEECEGLLLSTNELFKQLQDFYPSDYSPQIVVDLLCIEGWEPFFDPVLSQFFWKVKKL